MANISVILGHPNKDSFNHAIAQTVIKTLRHNNYDIFSHDLYAENFDPILPKEEISQTAVLPSYVEQCCQELCISDGIIVVHPVWWGQPPAILKGWTDRVLRVGKAYKFVEVNNGEGIPIGLLKAKAVVVFNTSNTPRDRELKMYGDPLETLWKNCIFGMCGITNFYRMTFSMIITSTPQQRKKWLDNVGEITDKYFPKL